MEDVMFVLELIGAAAFAVSGAMAAIEKKADIFGVLFLAVTTALGGGVIRDVLIGRIPPVMFVSYWYLLISVVAALAVFIDAYLRSEKYKLHLDKLDAVNNVFDAIGLAVFTVSGMNAAMPVSDNVHRRRRRHAARRYDEHHAQGAPKARVRGRVAYRRRTLLCDACARHKSAFVGRLRNARDFCAAPVCDDL